MGRGFLRNGAIDFGDVEERSDFLYAEKHNDLLCVTFTRKIAEMRSGCPSRFKATVKTNDNEKMSKLMKRFSFFPPKLFYVSLCGYRCSEPKLTARFDSEAT